MRRALFLLALCMAMVTSSTANAQPYSFSFSYGTGWPSYGSWSAPYPYPYWYGGPYFPGPVVLPPLYLPAETMYGPLAMQRFMGLGGVQTWQPPVIIANKAGADDEVVQKPK